MCSRNMSFSCVGFICVISVFVQMTIAHLCLITPRQRGDMDISTGGSHTCFRHGFPCGGQPAVFPPKIQLEAGRPVIIKWQQNYNHYTVGYPGYMDIAVAVANDVSKLEHHGNDTFYGPPSDPFRVLAVVADKDEYDQAHQRNYTAVVTMPNMGCEHCVIRARYVAHKPGETTFYQCADVVIKTNQITQSTQENTGVELHQQPSKNPNLMSVPHTSSKLPVNNNTLEKFDLISVLLSKGKQTIDKRGDTNSNIAASRYQSRSNEISSGEDSLKKAIDFTNSNLLNQEKPNVILPEGIITDQNLETKYLVFNKPTQKPVTDKEVRESHGDYQYQDQVDSGDIFLPSGTSASQMWTDHDIAKDLNEPTQNPVVTNEEQENQNIDDYRPSTSTHTNFLGQNDLQQSTSSVRIYGMCNNIAYPGNADLVSFDTVTGIRFEVAPLQFRVDSPWFKDRGGMRSRPLNSSIDFVTDGVLTLDSARNAAIIPVNRHNNMDATASTILEMDTRTGRVNTMYNTSMAHNKTHLPLKSAFSAAIVEIEATYITFNIEPDEKEDGNFYFIVGRLYAGGSWAMLSKTDETEDLYINFMWADYDVSVKTLYVLLGNENDALGLSARLYKFFVMPGTPPTQPSRDSSSYVTLDVSKYPFMAFHLHPYHSNLLYAVSPGLHNGSNPSYHLVVVDVDMGTVKEEMQIAPQGIFERFYGGAIIGGLNTYPPKLLHVLRVANTQADVIVTLDLNKMTASFSQVTNLRNVYNLYADFST